MICYECTQTEQSGSSAIGICSLCGLAVCPQHATITPPRTGLVAASRRVACKPCSGVPAA
jgi:hypothetical protein